MAAPAPLLAAPASALLRYFATDTHSPALGANASCLPPLPPLPPFFTGLCPAPYAPVALRLYPCANAWSLNCALPSGVNQDPSPFDLDRVTVILATPLDHSADHAHRSAHARLHQPRPPAAPSASPPISPISQAHQSSPSVNLVRDLHIGKLTRPTPPTTPTKPAKDSTFDKYCENSPGHHVIHLKYRAEAGGYASSPPTEPASSPLSDRKA